MATIKDVAKLAEVSTATVSAALNGTAYVSPELKARVERAMVALGYSTDGIARSLKKGMSSLIGLIIDDVTSPFYTELVDVIEEAAYDEGYSLLLCHTGRDVTKERKYISLLRTHRVDGIVWAPTGRLEDYPADEFKSFAIPLVFVDRVLSSFQSYDSVLLNNRAAGFQATNYLLDLGHRRIAMISGADFLEPARERSDGYRDALRKRGIPVDEDLVRNGNFREAEAFEECRKLLAEGERVSAILVANNQMLIGVMRALEALRPVVPQRRVGGLDRRFSAGDRAQSAAHHRSPAGPRDGRAGAPAAAPPAFPRAERRGDPPPRRADADRPRILRALPRSRDRPLGVTRAGTSRRRAVRFQITR